MTLICCVLSRMVNKEPKKTFSLLFYMPITLKDTSTQAKSFSLVYRAKPIVPIEVMVLLSHFALASKLSDPNESICDVEAL